MADFPSVQDFCSKWNLNDASVDLLCAASEDAQTKIMGSFAPRDSSRDVNNVFQSFVKSRAVPREEFKVDDVIDMEVAPHHEAFFEQWKLGTEAQRALLKLSPDIQADIIGKFQPRDTSRDVNGVFMAFLRSRSSGPGAGVPMAGAVRTRPGMASIQQTMRPMISAEEQDIMDQFVGTYGLNDEMTQMLLDMDSLVRNDVMANFRPRDTSRDMNACFWAFAKSRSGPRQAPGALRAPAAPMLKQFAPRTTTTQIIAQAAPQPPIRLIGHTAGLTVAHYRNELAIKFALTADSMAAFDELAPETQLSVYTEFKPRDLSRDANACFVSFCRSRMVQDFASKWKLNNESIQLFNSLDYNQQSMIMANFAPRDLGRDANSVFISFTKSRLAGPDEGRTPHATIKIVPAPPGPPRGIKRERPADGPADLESFIERWNLNDDNVVLLQGMTHQTQEQIMAKFHPRDTSRDCNAVFAKFASMERRL